MVYLSATFCLSVSYQQNIVTSIIVFCLSLPLSFNSFLYDLDYCHDQNTCYVYGRGTWDEGVLACLHVHPHARMIEVNSDEEGERYNTEAGTASFELSEGNVN